MKKSVIALAMVSFLAVGAASAGDWIRPAKNLAPLAPPPAVESCLSYDFVDLEYINTDFGSTNFDEGHGWGIGFSKSLGSNFFLTGSYADAGYEYTWVHHVLPVDTQRYRMGVGTKISLARCVDLTFEGGGEHLDAEYPGYNDHDYDSWTYYFGPGVRARCGRVEFFAKAFYFSREGDYSQEYLTHRPHYIGTPHARIDRDAWLFTPGFIFHVTDHFGVKLAAEFDTYDTSFLIGGRYHF